MGFDIFIKKLLVCKERLDVQDALDITEMLFAFPLLIKDHFPNFKPRINKNGGIGKESFDQADAIAVAFCHAIQNKDK